MFNHNGKLVSEITLTPTENYFPVFDNPPIQECIRIEQGKILLWEAHYFQIMGNMRLLRMDIPDHFSLEYLSTQILDTYNATPKESSAIATIYIYKTRAIHSQNTTSNVSFCIKIESGSSFFSQEREYTLGLYPENIIPVQNPFFAISSSSHDLTSIAKTFMFENNYDDCLLLNSDKNVARAVLGNLFIREGKVIKTPSFAEGGIKNAFREYFIDKIRELGYTIEETSVTLFEVQKAEEAFVISTKNGLKSIHHYLKNSYSVEVVNLLSKVSF